jgi:protein required for attachment to host cells
MRTIWIVVADAGRARIVSKAEGTGGLLPVQHLDNPAGRAHDSELVTDQTGRIGKHRSGIRSAMDPATDPHEEKASEFARELNRLLDAAAARHAYDLLVLVAPPHFLGLLKSGLLPRAKRRLLRSLASDLTKLSTLELDSHLAELIHFPVTTA